MNAAKSFFLKQRMQYGNITKSDDPFRIFSKGRQIKLIGNSDGSIASS